MVMLLQTVPLTYAIVRSKWSGWRLTAAVFVVFFGTVTFLNQIESLVYLGGRLPDGMLEGLFGGGSAKPADPSSPIWAVSSRIPPGCCRCSGCAGCSGSAWRCW